MNLSFKKDEYVIVYDNKLRRDSLSLCRIGQDSPTYEDSVLINFGAFNVSQSKVSVFKISPQLKKAIKSAHNN